MDTLLLHPGIIKFSQIFFSNKLFIRFSQESYNMLHSLSKNQSQLVLPLKKVYSPQRYTW